MSDITLKSIKFPGLSDRYTVPQVDNTLTQAGRPADAKKTGDELAAVNADITDLKTDLGVEFVDLEMGNIYVSASGWTYSNSSTRVRIKQGTTVHLEQGDIIGMTSYNGYMMYISWLPDGDTTYGLKGWLTTDFIAPTAGQYTVLMRSNPETTVSVATFEELFFIKRKGSITYQLRDLTRLDRLGSNLLNLSSLSDGYFETDGTIHIGTYGEKYGTEYIDVEQGATYKLVCTAKVYGTAWYRAVFYDGTTTMIGNLSNSKVNSAFDYYANGLGYAVFIFTVPSGAYRMRISWRAYGNGWAYLTKVGNYTSDDIEEIRKEVGNQATFNKSSWVKGINHAGYTLVAPENTLPAYVLSRKHGFKYVECDVQFTSDNVPVLLHDDTINRTARDSEGNKLTETVYIHNITYEDALTYDFGVYKSSDYAGTKIPSLEQFISLCKKIGLHPYIELKTGTTQAQVGIAVNIVKKYGMINNVTWISFSDALLGYVSAIHSKARLGFVTSTLTTSIITTIQALQNGYNEVFVELNYSALSDSTVQLCMDADLPLEIWTLDDLSRIWSLNQYVSGITSNRFNADGVYYGLGMN